MTYVEAVRTIVRTLPGGNALALRRLYSLADNPLFQSAVQCLAQAIQSSGVEVRVVADGKRRPIADHERSYRFDFWRGTLTDPFVASSQPPLRDLLICVEDLKREIADLKRRALMEAWAAYCEPSTADDKVTPLRRKA